MHFCYSLTLKLIFGLLGFANDFAEQETYAAAENDSDEENDEGNGSNRTGDGCHIFEWRSGDHRTEQEDAGDGEENGSNNESSNSAKAATADAPEGKVVLLRDFFVCHRKILPTLLQRELV